MMGATTGIEWSTATWPVVVGCTPVSPGCKKCWAARMASRGLHASWRMTADHGQWTGRIRVRPEVLDEPLYWKKPRRVFVAPMGDLFHEAVPFEFIADVYHVMCGEASVSPPSKHTYLVLTKRPDRMRKFYEWARLGGSGEPHHEALGDLLRHDGPPRRVWLGVTAEDQQRADERIPILLDTPAVVRFVSIEPCLGPVRLDNVELPSRYNLGRTSPAHVNALRRDDDDHFYNDHAAIDWVVLGSESGPGARPFNEDWARSVRDQCQEVSVPFFYKQRLDHGRKVSMPALDGRVWAEFPSPEREVSP